MSEEEDEEVYVEEHLDEVSDEDEHEGDKTE